MCGVPRAGARWRLTDGIDLLASIPDLGGCVGDLDGDGIGELASGESAATVVTYSGAEAAMGRAYELSTFAGTFLSLARIPLR